MVRVRGTDGAGQHVDSGRMLGHEPAHFRAVMRGAQVTDVGAQLADQIQD